MAIGTLLVNFGSLEFTAELRLHAVSSDNELVGRLKHLRLAQRIHLIRELSREGRAPGKHASAVDAAWARASELCTLRNQVAHNPVIFGWHGEERDGPPDDVGILDRRKNRTRAYIALKVINASADELVTVVQTLDALAKTIEAEAGWPAYPPIESSDSAT